MRSFIVQPLEDEGEKNWERDCREGAADETAFWKRRFGYMSEDLADKLGRDFVHSGG
jgi:hypothetical protein